MANNKVDLSLHMSKETALRFNAITGAMNLTNKQALSYLLDLYDKVGPKRDGFPEKRRTESHLHTCVQPEIKTKFRQLASEYNLSYDQLLTMLIDTHDQCPECADSLTERQTDAMATEAGDAGNSPMARLKAALNMIHGAFLDMATGNEEVKALREQLAQSQAETRRAKETYQRKLQAIAAQLSDLA